ncbi:MAG TPA: type II toxin-antitoxin system HicB family antitoxin [Gammaproteobacteria bacterium]|nr:type II toxin-antitoxin system HicB family antitoxin [Gammaproteobacteria bacterium]
MLIHKGYIGHVTFDDEAEIFHGEVLNTRDVITFQGESVAELKQAFIDSIEEYLNFCKKIGEEPDKPFSGKFNVRLDPQIHRDAVIAARKSGVSLNSWIANIVQKSLGDNHI